MTHAPGVVFDEELPAVTGAGIGPEPDPRPPGVVSSFTPPATCRKKAGLLCAGIALFNLIGLVGDLCSERVRRVVDRLPRTGAVWLVGIAGSPTAKTMCAAGAAGLPGRGAAAANVAGTVARVLIIWTAGRAVPGAGTAMASVAPWIAVPGGVALVTATVVRRFTRRPATTIAG